MLETKIENLTTAVLTLVDVLRAQRGAEPVAAAVAAPVASAPPAAPVAPPAMPAAPFAPPAAPAAPAGLPFNDNVSAAAWATSAWQQVAAVNQDVAMTKFSALMQSLGAADFNQLTPDRFPALYQGVQAIKAELGIAG